MPFCLNCDYDLRGLAESRCPECGRSFSLGDHTSTSPVPRRGKTKRRIVVVMVSGNILAIAAYLVHYMGLAMVSEYPGFGHAGKRIYYTHTPVMIALLWCIIGTMIVLPPRKCPTIIQIQYGLLAGVAALIMLTVVVPVMGCFGLIVLMIINFGLCGLMAVWWGNYWRRGSVAMVLVIASAGWACWYTSEMIKFYIQ